MDGFLLDVDTSKMREADNYFKSMVTNAEKLQSVLKSSLGDPNAFSSLNILERLNSFVKQMNTTKISPEVDVKGLEDVAKTMSTIVEEMVLLSKQKGFKFYDSTSIKDFEGNALRIQDDIDKIDRKIKTLKDEYRTLSEFKAPINPRTGKEFGKGSKTYINAVASYEDEKWRQIKQQQELKKGYQEDLKVAKMTEDEKVQMATQAAAKKIAADRKHVNEIRKEYRTLLSEQFDILKKLDTALKSGVKGGFDTKVIELYKQQFADFDVRRRSIEEAYSAHIVDIAEKAERRIADAKLRRIKESQDAEIRAAEEARQRYLNSTEGALKYAQSATTLNEMKDAQKYLQNARGNVNVADTDTIKKLNDEYTRLRATIEALTTAEKNEQSLQPTLRNEYIRLRKELDANREAQEKFAKLKNGNTADQTALVAREQDLQNKILAIKQNAGALLDETDRQYEAEKSRRAIELAEKTEAQRVEIAKRRMQEAVEQEKKTGVINSDKVNWRVDFLQSNVQNAAQAEIAIKSLENAKKRLNKEDVNYAQTVARVNQAISDFRNIIARATGEEQKSAQMSAVDAMNKARSAKSVTELKNALRDLKSARDRLNPEQDAAKIQMLNREISRAEKELGKYEQRQKNIQKNNELLQNSFNKLKGLAVAWLGVQAIKGYIGKVVEVRKEFEKQQKALQIILQNKEEANKIWQQTIDLALVSPFSLRELVTYTKQLAAYRIETSKLHQTTKMLADVSAGVGVDMNRLILAFGQVRAASFLRATELRQFTEAGIPLLEELSSHLSNVYNRFISVGDVMDMISKRKVSFADVEDTFEKMTGEGGVFYKMQEQQAQTVSGMLSNLKDSVDLMFNDIGKSNEGFIKNFIQGITYIVKHWRDFEGLFTGAVVALALGKITTMLAAIVLNIGKAIKGATTLRGAFLALNATSIGAIVGAIAGLVTWIAISCNQVDELQRKFMEVDREQTKSLNDAIRNFSELASKIRSVTTSFSEKNKALVEMKRLYGDILPDMMLTEKYIKAMSTGYTEATDALREHYNAMAVEQKRAAVESKYNEGLEDTVDAMFTAFKGARQIGQFDRVSFMEYIGADENTVKSIIEQVLDATRNGTIEINSILDETVKRLEKYYGIEGKLQELMKNKEVYSTTASVAAFYSNAKQLIEPYKKGMSLAVGLPDETLEDKKARENLETLNKLYKERVAIVNKLKEKLDSLYTNQSTYTAAEIKELQDEIRLIYSDELKVAAPENLFQDVQNSALQTKQEIERVNVEVRNLFAAKYKKEYGGDIVTQMFENVDKEVGKIKGGQFRQTIEEMMKEVASVANLNIFDQLLVDDKQSLENYRKVVNEEYDRMKDAVEAYKTALQEAGLSIVQQEMVNTIHNKELMEQYEKALPILLKYKNLLGGDVKKKKTGDRSNSLYDERIKVIDDMSKKYEELRKVFSEDEARTGAFEAYKDAFAKAYKGIKWVDKNVKQMTPEEFMQKVLNFPDKNKIVEFLDRLAKEPKKAFEQIKVELAKGEYVHEMKLEAKLESDKDLTKKIEAMFKDYELSLDVQKMGLSAFDAKDMFNLDVLNLEQLKQQLRDAHSEFIGKDKEEEYKEFFARIYELEEEQRIEQMKKYSKYLANSMTERVKLKKEELAQLAELEKLNFTDEQKALIRNSIQQESQAKMNKLDWEEFKNSDMYIRIFQDIDGASTKTLQHMRAKLAEMKSQLKNLDPKEVKAIVSEMEKIDEALAKKNPFKTAITGLDDYIKAVKKAKEIEKEYLEGQQKEDDLEKQENLVSNMLGAEQANLKKMNESGDATELDISLQQNKIQQLQQQLLLLQQQLKKQKEINEANGQAVQKNEETKKKFTDSLKDVGAQISSAASALPQVAADLEHVFGAMDAGTKDTVESISEIGGGIGNAITGFASGNYIQGVLGVTQAIAGIFNIGDKKKERAIQRELKRVEELQKEYEKLDEKIQTMYNIDDINVNYNAMKKNLNEQIASTEKMIQLENDKKKTDHARIAEFREQIEEYKKQLEELEDARIRQLGGIAGDDDYLTASQNFVDAWLDAFRETGDGLSGLEEQFDEVYMNLVKKQLLGRGVDKMLKPLYENLELMLDDGAMSKEDYSKFSEQWNALAPNLNEFLSQMVNDLGIVDEITKNAGSLSGLQEGISGITEDQADILAAYWSSVRFIVSNIEQKFTAYADQMLGANSEDNPIVIALKAQTAILEEIRDALSSVITTGSTVSGARLKLLM